MNSFERLGVVRVRTIRAAASDEANASSELWKPAEWRL